MKFLRILQPRKISVRLFLAIAPQVLLLSLIISILGPRENKKQALAAVADKSRNISQMIAFSLGPALYFDDAEAVNEIIRSAQLNKDLVYLTVFDQTGRAVGSFNKGASLEADFARLNKGIVSSDGRTYHLAAPVIFRETERGRIFLGLSLDEVLHRIELFRKRLILIGLFVFSAGTIAAYFLSLLITRPLRMVSETARQIAHGDKTKRAKVKTMDEVGRLAMAFNTMVDALEESHRTLENKVSERTQEIQAEIDERKRVEEALRESEENFRSMVENLGEGIGIISPDESFTFANKSLEDIFGVPPGSLAGKNMRDFTGAEQFEKIRIQTELRRKGEKSSYDIEIIRADGAKRTIFGTAIPRFGPGGEFAGSLVLFTDITERKLSEEALREANVKLQQSVGVLERRATEMKLLSELYDSSQACREEQEIFETTRRYARELFPEEAGVLYIFKESRNLLDAAFSWGEGTPRKAYMMPDECWALRRTKIHQVEDGETGLICSHAKTAGRTTPPYLCIPLLASGAVIGLLHIRFKSLEGEEARRSKKPIGPLQQGLAQTFSERIASAIDNLRLRQRLRQQSIRDSLTGLFNRRYMEETLDRELARALRTNSTLGVIMMDIDKFKSFNDSFGHEAGDTMLKAIGTFLLSHVRKEDVVCRYGGEEFIIILPAASLEDASQRAESLCREAKAFRVSYGERMLGPISFSLGVASFPAHGDSAVDLVKVADEALLMAKKEGRNRVMVAGNKKGSNS